MQQRVGNVRWGIAGLLGTGIVINYLDRVNISVATQPLEQQFHLSAGEMGIILSAYLWSYVVLQIPVGAMLDRFGVTWLVRIGTFVWSLATYMTAIVSGLGLVILSRILLGAAEAPIFPAAAKATGYWFPTKERGLATSAFDAAAKFANVIGIPLVAFAVTIWGWRAGFYMTGTLSLLYCALFWIGYYDPSHAKRLTSTEHAYIVEGGAQPEGQTSANPLASLGFLLRQPKVWGLTLGFAAYGYSFYLFLSWIPGYLQTALHMTVLKSGFYTIIPWVVATITDIVIGGWLVDHLIKRGHDATRVRKVLFTIGLILGIAVIGAAFTTNPNVAITWISIALGGLAFAAPIGWSIPGLIAPKGTVGTVGSIMNFFNNLAGIVAPIAAGFIFDSTHSFALNFLVAGGVLVLGIICFLVLIGRIEPIHEPQQIGPRPEVATGTD